MRRRLFNILCGLSLLLCVASTAIWISSYFAAQLLVYGFPSSENPSFSDDLVAIGWSDGAEYLVCFPNIILLKPDRPGFQWLALPGGIALFDPSHPTHTPQRLMNVLGIGWDSYNQPHTIRAIIFPAWLQVIVTGILPAIWIIRCYRSRVERMRQKRGLCLRCGYDLRATPKRCPECGTLVAAKESA